MQPQFANLKEADVDEKKRPEYVTELFVFPAQLSVLRCSPRRDRVLEHNLPQHNPLHFIKRHLIIGPIT